MKFQIVIEARNDMNITKEQINNYNHKEYFKFLLSENFSPQMSLLQIELAKEIILEHFGPVIQVFFLY